RDGIETVALGRIQTVRDEEDTLALVFQHVKPDDAGLYTCVANTSSGKIACSAELTVQAPPSFIKEIKRIECRETETIKFEIKVGGDPIPKVTWSVSGEEIKIDGKHFRTEADDRNFTLTVDSVTRKDAGSFTCTLTNEFGSTSASADLVVNCTPQFDLKLKDMTVKEGDVDVKFDVKLTGTPEPKIRWFIDGMEIDEKKNNNFKVVDDGDKHTLVIKKVSPDVSGKFTIKASNPAGEAECSAALTVLYKPKFTEKLTDIEVTERETVVYTVKCVGNPEPKIKWYKDNEDITVDASIKFTHQSSENWTMTLDCVAASAAGKYECRASNSEGDSSTESNLTVNILQVEDEEFIDGTVEISEEFEKSYEEDSNEMTIRLNEDEAEGAESSYIRIESTEKSSFELIEDSDGRSLTAEFEKDVLLLKENIIAGSLDSGLSPSEDKRRSSDEGVWWLEEEEVITTQVKHELTTKEDIEVDEDAVEIPELRVDVNLKHIRQDDVQQTPTSADISGGLVIEEIEESPQLIDQDGGGDGAKPTFGKGLEDIDAWLGLEAILEVQVDAIPEAEVKWLKDGQPIAANARVKIEKINNIHRLIIAETATEDNGTYKCIIKNKIGESTSQATLHVKTPADAKGPVFTHPLQSVSCIKGQCATFQVTILGNPAPLIKWLKDGKEITEGDKYHMEKISAEYLYRLTIDKCTEEDGGKYSVNAANEHSEDTSEAVLSIKVPPEIVPPTDQVVLPKGSATVEATVTGVPQPKVCWCKDGKPLTEGAKFKVTSDDKKGVYTLAMNQVDLDDGGDYEIVAENEAGTLKKAFKLLFTTAEPKFTKSLTSQSVKPTTSVQMDVEVDGIPLPVVTWMFGGSEISSDDHVTLKQNSDRSYSLLIAKFDKTDEGEYECKAKSPVGQAVSKGKLLVKHEKPSFTKHLPKETCAMDGESFMLECKVDGSPQPAVKCAAMLANSAAMLANSAAMLANSAAMLEEVSFETLQQHCNVAATFGVTWVSTMHRLKDGREIQPGEGIKMEYLPDGTARLTVDNAKPSDIGKYSLVATNETGEHTSTGAVSVETMPKPPVIIGGLKKTKVTEGTPLQLSTKITGHPKPSVKWFKDGKPIKSDRAKLVQAPDGTISLTIENAQPEDRGNYSVQVANSLGECSSAAEVSVEPAEQVPEFGVKIKGCEAFEGFPIKLEGKVKGQPAPTLKWLKDGQELIPDGERIVASMQPDGSFALIVNNAKPEDKGKYTVVATNAQGTAESSADIGVNARVKTDEPTSEPIFITPLRDVTVDEGTPLKLQAHVTSNPIPDLVWKKDDVPLSPSDPRLSICFDGDRISLEVKKSNPNDAGKYECSLTNPHGTSASTCEVQVKKLAKLPFFTQRFPDVDAITAQDARFACRISGLPTPDVSWYFNDKPIFDSDKYKVKKEGDLHALYVKNCAPEDIGNISCFARNDDGEDKCVAFLNVASTLDKKIKTELPSFLKKLKDCEVIEGMPGKFTACISGYPEPEYKWCKDGRELFPSDRIKFEVEPHGLLRLIIKDIKPDDIGRYQLRITNPHGCAECDALLRCEGLDERKPKRPMLDLNIEYDKLKKTGIPFALPDKPIISKMTDRRLTLSWKPSLPVGPRVPVTYIVEMCEVEPDADWMRIQHGIRGCCCEIKNLEPYRDYKYRVRVENKYGVSDPSPYATAYRTKLEMTPPRMLPFIPSEFDFRPETSPYFPKDYDFDKPIHEQYAHAPRFLRQETDAQYGTRNQPSSIHWFVYGYPVPTISWYFNDEKIELLGRYESSFTSRNGQANLYINRFLERDVGIYECVAINEHGESRQRVRMEIAELPTFISYLEETTITVRESGRLECRLIGVPYPYIKWYKDWHPIVSSDRIKIEWKEPDLCTLSINGAISKDSGLYSCAARNVIGTTQCSAMLTVEESEQDYMSLTFNHNRVIKASHNKHFEDFYDIGDELGRGTQGIIYHTVERSTGNSYAAKIMHGRGEFRDYMNHELDIMNQLHNRYLIRGIDAFDTKKGLTLITELYPLAYGCARYPDSASVSGNPAENENIRASGGLLLDTLCRQSVLTESEIAYYIRQTLWGLEHMHSKGIAHLGLTPADILLARPGGDDIRICDFGLARRLIKGQDYILDYGMPEYVAPEIANRHPVSFYTDMWSVGVITYVLMSGISPFLGENDRQTLQQVQQGKINFDTEVFSHISDEGRDFILKLLVFDQEGRMDVKTALKHSWLKMADRPGGEGYSTDRLINYHKRYREWVLRSGCRRFYRRRPLSSAYSHPSKMVYPPDEEYTPPSSPELDRAKPAPWDKPGFSDKVDREHENMDNELGYFDSDSRYQNGPDTYLLQLRDIDFPLRLREYMRVAGVATPSLGVRLIDTLLGKSVTIHERRRFTDIMDEEIDDEKKGVSNSGKKRISSEISPRSETKNRLKELLPLRDDGEAPFFREKINDVAFVEGEHVELTCFAVGDPKPTVQWYRNDVMLSETHRLKFIESEDGRSTLRFTPIKSFDAGVFKAIARNPLADTSCRARLRVGDIPGRMEAPEVSQISNCQALVTWVPPKGTGNSVIGGYELEMKEHSASDWDSVCKNIDHEFFVVRGLKPQTSYNFRVKAANKFGRGEFSVPSAIAATGDDTCEALTVSKAMKHQQELSEGRQEQLDFTPKQQQQLDYTVEENPVELSTGNPTDKFNFLSEIARGQFSVVLKCCSKNEPGDKFYAAKVIDGSTDNEEKAKHEFAILSSINHQRIASLHEAFLHNTNYVFVMEKLHGYDVLTYLTSRHQYNEETVTKIISQLLDALEYLHFRQIAHLDIQPDNVVMNSLQLVQLKLVDMGSAQRVPRNGSILLTTQPGLMDYRAPEVVSNAEVNSQADVWSVGVLTYVLLSGSSPFLGSDDTETKENINFVRYRFENLHKEITPEATRFLMQIFKKTPFKRLTIDECLEHKWLNPSELMLRKRERAVFLSSRIQQYATDYHQKRLENASRSANLASSLGTQVERSISVECNTNTTF
uniref:Muscle M-line assembly protein unc-89 n=1 Tax=Strigamia maritima TaxID=126957 RepID=T1IIA6_STRMM